MAAAPDLAALSASKAEGPAARLPPRKGGSAETAPEGMRNSRPAHTAASAPNHIGTIAVEQIQTWQADMRPRHQCEPAIIDAGGMASFTSAHKHGFHA